MTRRIIFILKRNDHLKENPYSQVRADMETSLIKRIKRKEKTMYLDLGPFLYLLIIAEAVAGIAIISLLSLGVWGIVKYAKRLRGEESKHQEAGKALPFDRHWPQPHAR